jgi:hypothetical protein
MTVYVLEWAYLDGSARGIVGLYADEELARYTLHLLEWAPSGKTYTITSHNVEGRALRPL